MDFLTYPFDSSEILKKKKAIKRLLLERQGLLEKRIAIVSGSTIGDIKDILELFLLYYGIKPQFITGLYNRFYEDIMFENHEIHDFKPDIILIHTTSRNLSDDKIWSKLCDVWTKIRETFACPIVQNNFELPIHQFSVNCHNVNELNIKIAEYSKKNKDFYVVDIQHLSACYGLDKWYDDQVYYLYKYAFDINAIPSFCHNVAKVIKSIYNMNQKCLVLDLDNTLWGGVIGERGVDGIEVGPDSPLGEAYSKFQSYVKLLHDRGVILAICSKNEEHIARSGFNNHNMVLKLDDIAVFSANWNNKVDNILKIANTLNIMTESIVFVDDNPVERDLVRRLLPEVKVPEASSPIDFIQVIDRAGYFDIERISNDDLKRNEYYINDKVRNEEMSSFTDYDEFLKSLKMTSVICPFSMADLERITQLVNKTNQFNLTTKRYTYNELEEIAKNENYITLYATLDDRFGSNGIVSVIVGEISCGVLNIRLWVMSCRVFKRDLELAVFDRLVEICRERDITEIIGYYYKTSKNGYVSDLFKDLGFRKKTDELWQFDDIENYQCKNRNIQTRKEDNYD